MILNVFRIITKFQLNKIDRKDSSKNSNIQNYIFSIILVTLSFLKPQQRNGNYYKTHLLRV